jgi:hypothetical protein
MKKLSRESKEMTDSRWWKRLSHLLMRAHSMQTNFYQSRTTRTRQLIDCVSRSSVISRHLQSNQQCTRQDRKLSVLRTRSSFSRRRWRRSDSRRKSHFYSHWLIRSRDFRLERCSLNRIWSDSLRMFSRQVSRFLIRRFFFSEASMLCSQKSWDDWFQNYTTFSEFVAEQRVTIFNSCLW